MTKPHALLRAGFPYYATLGMRRVTTSPADLVACDNGEIFVLNRVDGEGGEIRRTNWEDEDNGKDYDPGGFKKESNGRPAVATVANPEPHPARPDWDKILTEGES